MNRFDRSLIAGLAARAEPRPKTIHAAPCKQCPSAHYPPDPLSLDMLSASRAVQLVEGIFPCAWRPSRLCKGACDWLNVTESELAVTL